MLSVLPSINCHYRDDECVEKKLRACEEFAEMVHLDIADGAFTFGKSWNDVARWKKLNPKVRFEVHLMVEHPEREAEQWLSAGASRIVFHVESLLHPHGRHHATTPSHVIEELLMLGLRHKAEMMIAINPETPLETIEPYMKKFKAFQVFAQAHMGPPGQKFLPSVLPKIKFLRDTFHNATIEVDGGINLETAMRVKDAGADTVIAGTYVLGAPNPKDAYEELRNI
jgi:ribulose-phosphate 3-epimerase